MSADSLKPSGLASNGCHVPHLRSLHCAWNTQWSKLKWFKLEGKSEHLLATRGMQHRTTNPISSTVFQQDNRSLPNCRLYLFMLLFAAQKSKKLMLYCKKIAYFRSMFLPFSLGAMCNSKRKELWWGGRLWFSGRRLSDLAFEPSPNLGFLTRGKGWKS